MRLTKYQLEVVRLVANNYGKITTDMLLDSSLQCLIRKRVLYVQPCCFEKRLPTKDLLFVFVRKDVGNHFKLFDDKFKIKA